MEYRRLHKWNLPVKAAMRLQNRLREKVVIKRLNTKKIRLIAGVDVSVKENRSKAAIVVMTYPDLKTCEIATALTRTAFSYVPGLLSFREAGAVLKCVRKLKNKPDLFIFDGQGLAHPRGLGLASHMGLVLNKPTIGSAKSHLYGEYLPPEKHRGAFSYIKDPGGRKIGVVLRIRDNTKCIFVSPGHLTDIPSAIEILLAVSPKYRIPEPIRAAHKAAAL